MGFTTKPALNGQTHIEDEAGRILATCPTPRAAQRVMAALVLAVADRDLMIAEQEHRQAHDEAIVDPASTAERYSISPAIAKWIHAAQKHETARQHRQAAYTAFAQA